MGNPHINEGVHVQNVAAVATISFAHPKHNCFPQAQLKALTAAIDTCAQDDTVRVILLQSDPTKAFCAGASFDELLAVQTPQQGKSFFMGFASLIFGNRSLFYIKQFSTKSIALKYHKEIISDNQFLLDAGLSNIKCYPITEKNFRKLISNKKEDEYIDQFKSIFIQ